jgi:hypothetical protein
VKGVAAVFPSIPSLATTTITPVINVSSSSSEGGVSAGSTHVPITRSHGSRGGRGVRGGSRPRRGQTAALCRRDVINY